MPRQKVLTAASVAAGGVRGSVLAAATGLAIGMAPDRTNRLGSSTLSELRLQERPNEIDCGIDDHIYGIPRSEWLKLQARPVCQLVSRSLIR